MTDQDRLAALLHARERFDAKVMSTEAGCWVWTGNVSASGYGRFYFGGHLVQAHRWAWELLNGPIADGLVVCHTCDNPPCVRIDHLFLGTVADNNADMRAKGRDGGWAAEKASRAVCVNGHPFTDANTRMERGGTKRVCRACSVVRTRKYKSARRVAA